MSAPLSVKLACRSWQQLSAIHSRDLSRSAFFLKTEKPPPIGTAVRISLRLPSGSTVELVGSIDRWVAMGEMDGRGPGIDVSLEGMSQTVMWLIESALSSAGLPPRPVAVQDKKTQDPVIPSAPVLNLADGDEFVAAEGELVNALREELRSMARMNAFQLLAVSADSTDEAVRSAFGALSKKYHPDRFTRYESTEIRDVASEVFILLRNAYQETGSAQGRQALARKLGRPQAPSKSRVTPPPTPTPTPTPPPPPQKLSLPLPPRPIESDDVLRTDDLPTLDRGPVLAPPSGDPPTRDYSQPDLNVSARQSQVASNRVDMAMNILDSGHYEQALKILKTEAHKDPNNITALAGVELAEGRLALASGNRMEAAERFEAALDIDPSNERAAHEIADMRRHATSQRRGLLAKLMKRV